MSVVLNAHEVSTKVVKELFRDAIESAAADANQPLTDPKQAARAANPKNAPLVMTSFPAQNRFYPHVIIKEAGRTGGRIDPAADVSRYDYTVEMEIHAELSGDLYQLRDGLVHWIESQYHVLGTAGFQDVRLVSSTPTSWDPTSQTKSWSVVVQGRLHTRPNYTP